MRWRLPPTSWPMDKALGELCCSLAALRRGRSGVFASGVAGKSISGILDGVAFVIARVAMGVGRGA